MELLKFIESKKRYFVIGIIMAIGFVAVFTGVKGIAKNDSKPENQSQGVITAKDISINTKIAGRIVKFYVSEGDTVKQGDIIVEISSGELMAKKEQILAQITQAQAGVKASQATLNQAQAGVEAAQSVVNMAQAGYNVALEKVKQAQTGVSASEKQRDMASAVNEKAQKGARTQELAQAESAYSLWKSTYDRAKNLYEGGAISAQKLEEIKTQMEVSKQTLEMAKEGARSEDKAAANAQLGLAEVGINSSTSLVNQAQEGANAALSQLNQAQAGLRASQAVFIQAQAGLDVSNGKLEQINAGLAEVEVYLEDTLIKSPMDGTVTALNSDEGELVSTGTSIGTISNLDYCWISVNLNEDKLSIVKEGQTVKVTLPTYKRKTFTGTVLTINKQPDFATKKATSEKGNLDIVSYGVKIELVNPDQIIRPGMSATVDFEG